MCGIISFSGEVVLSHRCTKDCFLNPSKVSFALIPELFVNLLCQFFFHFNTFGLV